MSNIIYNTAGRHLISWSAYILGYPDFEHSAEFIATLRTTTSTLLFRMLNSKVHPVDVHVGGRMRMRRMMAGISQEKLADRLGVTFQQVQKYEKGFTCMCASRLHDAADLLEVPVSYFFEGLADATEAPPQEPNPPGQVPEDMFAREGMVLNRSFARIGDAAMRQALLGLITAMAAREEAESSSRGASADAWSIGPALTADQGQ